MELKVLGSNSAGNCYVFDNGNEALVLECGVSLSAIKKALDFDIARIAGCLITHEHGDHAARIKDMLQACIPCYSAQGTIDVLNANLQLQKLMQFFHAIKAGKQHKIGNFNVIPFATKHDAAEPFGYLIHHPEMGVVLFATDTYYLPNKFSNLNNILIECNYRIDILDANIQSGSLAANLRNRTVQSHMSYHTCIETLLANDLSAVNNIVLIHLSDKNSNANEFKHGVAAATGKTVHVATKGLQIKFNKTPF